MRRKAKEKPDPVSAYLAEIGARGGRVKVPKGAAVLSPEDRRARAKKMAEARWGKKAEDSR